MQKKKEISTLIGSVIIIVATIIIFSGVVIYQNYVTQRVLAILLENYSSAAVVK